jgi:magnesium-transporting ATPase (P-type)
MIALAEQSTAVPGRQWHQVTGEVALSALAARASGLSAVEALRRMEQHGPNTLPELPRQHWSVRLLRQLHNTLIYVLLLSAGVSSLLGDVADTLVILAVVVANAAIGFVQEGKAEKAIDAIRGLLALEAEVLRDGHRVRLPAREVVPGDVVLLEAGDKVPADLRLLEARNLKAQESILTGEAVAVEKATDVVAGEALLAERADMAYSGTLVISGQGRGVVVATGAATEMGRINGMLSRIETLTTPLVAQMDRLGRRLSAAIVLTAMLLLGFGYFVRGMDFAELFMAVVGLAVAAIPEGLPAVLTISLAIGVQAMARQNAIVRRLPAIETLSSVSVICTDKTGTLTLNEMTVASVIQHGAVLSLEGAGYSPVGEVRDASGELLERERTLLELARAAVLCNDAALLEQDREWKVAGDPMEGALLAFAAKAGLEADDVRRSWSRTDAIPFDSRHGLMATLDHDHDGHAFIHVKGAPERLLALCSAERRADGGSARLDLERWRRQSEQIAARGQRVLALAVRPVDANKTVLELDDLERGLVLLGMVGLIDPPRPEAVLAVARCREAGIAVKMITGDHAATARAIGAEVGLANVERVLGGAGIDALNDAELAQQLSNTDIFARTTPEQKLRLVMALQARGMTVAMTGDGVNDAPALKRADIGIAMGRKGSEAAREAAELVLADDNFASIVAAVREGRTVYENIRKVISWTLPTSIGEAVTVVIALLLGLTLPITPVQILWINLITGATLGIALVFEPSEPDTMRRPPRSPTEPLLGRELLRYIVLVSALFSAASFWLYFHALGVGHSIARARTIVVNALVLMEIFQLFFVRNLHGQAFVWQRLRASRLLWSLVAVVLVGQGAVTYIPPLQQVFATEALSLYDLMLILVAAVATLLAVELEKQLRLWLRA